MRFPAVLQRYAPSGILLASDLVLLVRRLLISARAPWRRGGAAVMAAIIAGVGLVGCESRPDGRPSASASSISAPDQDARGSAEQQALTAYRGMWLAYAKAGLTANPDEPELAKYAADEALELLRAGLATYKSKGHVLKGEYETNPRIIEAAPVASPRTLSINDCLDDSRFLVHKTSGEPVNDILGGRRSTRAMVTNFGADGWKVTSFGVQAVGTC